MKELGIPLEINVLGMQTGRNYPNERFWELAGEIGNDVVFGLDAHKADGVRHIKSYRKCADLAERFGLKILEDVTLKRP